MKIHGQDHVGLDQPTGILLYPSRHFQLSRAKREAAELVEVSVTPLSTGIKSLDEVLEGGLLDRTACALLAPVGNIEKVIAAHYLAEGAKQKNRIIYVSLASDPSANFSDKDNLISLPRFIKDNLQANDLEILERNLEILSFRPGYISTDEFITRIVDKLRNKARTTPVKRLVFDGVAHIPLRFPLVAVSQIFILTTLIDLCKSYGFTSLFLGLTEGGHEDSLNSALTVLADYAFRLSNVSSVTTQLELLKMPSKHADRLPWSVKIDKTNDIKFVRELTYHQVQPSTI